MKFSLWLLVGFVSVAVPFFLGYDQHDLWNSVIGGVVGAGIYFFLLYIFAVRKIFSLKEKFFLGSGLTVFLIAFGIYTVGHYKMTTYQRETLSLVRTYIGTEIITYVEIHSRTLPVLRSYFDQSPTRNKSIVKLFEERYADQILNGEFKVLYSNNQQIGSKEMPPRTFVSYQSDTAVILVSVDTIAHGIRSDFRNITGHLGKLQITALLSKHGVKYARNN